MGLVLNSGEIGATHLALEIRRESVILMDIDRKYPHELTPPADPSQQYPRCGESEHIFCYQEGEIEVSKEFLLELVKFLDHPSNRAKVFGPYADLGKPIR
jgi:hypothetical protein